MSDPNVGREGAGWDALMAGEWATARAKFEAGIEEAETPALMDGLARARWWLADIDGAIEAWERAYARYRRVGDDAAAARVALFLWKEYGATLRDHAVAGGWLARARDLLDGMSPSAAHGWLWLAESETGDDEERAFEFASRALETGPLLRDPDLELASMGRVGLAEIRLGRVEEGMTRFDASLAAATAGEPHDLRTLGDLFCSAMMAAELTLEADPHAVAESGAAFRGVVSGSRGGGLRAPGRPAQPSGVGGSASARDDAAADNGRSCGARRGSVRSSAPRDPMAKWPSGQIDRWSRRPPGRTCSSSSRMVCGKGRRAPRRGTRPPSTDMRSPPNLEDVEWSTRRI